MESARADLDRLAAAAKGGDREAFRAMVEGMTRPLIAFAFRYVRDWETARDLTQETWVRVWRSLGRFRTESSFRTWLYAIHRNGCLDHLRSAVARREAAADEEAAARLPDPAPGPEAEWESREFHRRVLAAAGRLSEKQRRVFALVDLEGIAPAEAAFLLEMHPGTLRSTLHAARRGIARRLGGREHD